MEGEEDPYKETVLFYNENYTDTKNFSQLLNSITEKLTLEDIQDITKIGFMNKLKKLIKTEINNCPFHKRPLYYINTTITTISNNYTYQTNNLKDETYFILLKEDDEWHIEIKGQEYKTLWYILKLENDFCKYIDNNLKNITNCEEIKKELINHLISVCSNKIIKILN